MRHRSAQRLDAYPKSWTKAQRIRAMQGLHPTMGEPYLEERSGVEGSPTCGNCKHLQSGHTRYNKCALIKATSGRGTDIQVRWDACRMWKDTDGT